MKFTKMKAISRIRFITYNKLLLTDVRLIITGRKLNL